ncbi:MAG: M23 family metallopeptidase [Bacilli bacterium]|nr:M23 family metallopeptidase [Bacilli bacterium]
MAKKRKEVSKISKLFSKFLVFVILVLSCLIVLKSNPSLKASVYKKVFESNFSFAKINDVYKKYFGSSLPLKSSVNADVVSASTIEYNNISKYKDGAKLTVRENYLVPSMDSGLIIFIGEKDGYGNTVIVQRPDNVEVWYCNLKTVGTSLYDYIKKGDSIGEALGTNIYLVFKKSGKSLDYKKYI